MEWAASLKQSTDAQVRQSRTDLAGRSSHRRPILSTETQADERGKATLAEMMKMIEKTSGVETLQVRGSYNEIYCTFSLQRYDHIHLFMTSRT